MLGLRGPKPQVSQALSLPAPTGGINDLDPLAAMEPQFLIDTMNFFPDTGSLNIRNGYKEWVTGLAKPVKTIMAYNRTDGSYWPFAVTDDGVFDIRASSNNPAAALSPISNGQVEWTNYATAATDYLIFCNGTGTWHFTQASGFTHWTQVTTPASPGEIKGVNPNTFNFVLAHKARLWFLVNNSMTAYYLPIDSIGGEAKPFFLGGLFKRGGYLVALARWSQDTGEGLDDRLLFISSTGEIASYSGDDPSNAADWTLDAVFFIGPPLGPRAITEFGGDVLYLSRRGLIPLSSLIQGAATEVLYSAVLSRRISRTLIRLTAPTSPRFPVELGFNAELALIAINVFDITVEKPIQLVLNFLNGAWGKFDYPVRTIRTVDRTIYMGTDDGRVLIITLNQHVDNVLRDGTGGNPIEGSLFSAYTHLDDLTVNKHAKFIRPVFQTEIKPSFKCRVLPDYRLDPFLLPATPSPARGNAKWDLSLWDTAVWAGVENVYRPWVSANVLGYSFAWQCNVSTSTFLGVSGIQWVWEAGGLI